MILVDTSVWIDHLQVGEPALTNLLEEAEVCVHPLVVGELALGSIRDRGSVLPLLANLPVAAVASHLEVLQLVEAAGTFRNWPQPGGRASACRTENQREHQIVDA